MLPGEASGAVGVDEEQRRSWTPEGVGVGEQAGRRPVQVDGVLVDGDAGAPDTVGGVRVFA
ncbi:hypothetical protein Acsp03_56850 [Actinomadura sp. NBRC 104412]|nr:hypothetical protein Acsp03_56850 [Actinomadura sp. NBRC 104412]